LRQQWRQSINRFAEAMTIFAVACAGLFPLLHLGRPWYFYWLLPYPDTMSLWPQFRSPLVWDVFAVLTYFTISLLFWFVGLIPDFATLRDRSPSRPGRFIYGMLAMAWRGSARHCHRQNMATIRLATGLIVAYGYMIEAFMAWYGGNPYEQYTIWNRLTGPYAPFYWALLLCNIAAPQVLWLRRVRTSASALFVISLIVNTGMWLERFVIVVTSLHRDFLPSSWGMYYPTIWDVATFVGTLGLFATLFFLFT